MLANLGSLPKRTTYPYSWPINKCPQAGSGTPLHYTHFKKSACISHLSPREYTIACGPDSLSPPRNWYPGMCGPLEVCVDDPTDNALGWRRGVYPTSRCVSLTNFFKLDATEASSVKQATFYTQDGQSLELILTESGSSNILVKADSISLAARDANDNVLDQPVECSSCGVLKFEHFPAGTAHLDANVKLPHDRDRASLRAIAWTDSSQQRSSQGSCDSRVK